MESRENVAMIRSVLDIRNKSPLRVTYVKGPFLGDNSRGILR